MAKKTVTKPTVKEKPQEDLMVHIHDILSRLDGVENNNEMFKETLTELTNKVGKINARLGIG